MTLNKDKDEMINSLLKRNLYLESIIFGKNKNINERIFNTPISFIVKESETGEILGNFLDEISAKAFSETTDFHSVCEPWAIQVQPTEAAPPVIIPDGTRVTVNNPHPVTGKLLSNDGDLSCGIEKVIYKFIPDGLPNEEESIIVIYHSDIEEVLSD